MKLSKKGVELANRTLAAGQIISRENLLPYKGMTEQFLVWLLSDERKSLVMPENQQQVTDADVANFAFKLREEKRRADIRV